MFGGSREVAYGRFRHGSAGLTGLLVVSYKQTLSRPRGQLECHIAECITGIRDCPLQPLRGTVDKPLDDATSQGSLTNLQSAIRSKPLSLRVGMLSKPKATSSSVGYNKGPPPSSLQEALSPSTVASSKMAQEVSNSFSQVALSKAKWSQKNKQSGAPPVVSSLQAASTQSKPELTLGYKESCFRPLQAAGALSDGSDKEANNPTSSPTTVVDDYRFPANSKYASPGPDGLRSDNQGHIFDNFRRALDIALVKAFALLDGDEYEQPESLEARDVWNKHTSTDFMKLSEKEKQIFLDDGFLTVDIFKFFFSMALLVVRPGSPSLKNLTTTTIFLSRDLEWQYCKRKEKSRCVVTGFETHVRKATLARLSTAKPILAHLRRTPPHWNESRNPTKKNTVG